MDSPVVKFSNVSKTYSLYKKRSDKFLEILSFRKNGKTFSALSNLSFEVFKGETIGIIGVNGSGKSTLSNVLAQVTPQSSGDIYINGETSLVAISAGLNNQLSGLENIELKCLMHGLNKRKIKEITPSIIDFADIGDFINQPIKSYSSGMKSRLGFAISAHIQPDILVVDEALSVGDSTFYQKCLDKFDEFKEQGKTIFFISHSLSQVKAISDRIMWLNFGRVEEFDETKLVARKYTDFIKWFNNLTKDEQRKYRKKQLKSQTKTHAAMNGEYLSKGLSRSSIKKKNKKKKLSVKIQMSFLILLFTISVLLMFIEHPINTIKNNFNISETEVENHNNTLTSGADSFDQTDSITINEAGLISAKSRVVYKDRELTEEISELAFADEVFVLEEFGNSVYKIKVANTYGYIPSAQVQLLKEAEFKISELTIDELVPLFPESFSDSYSFLLLFLNEDYQKIKESLQGLSNEYEGNAEETILEYGANDMSFIIEDGISQAVFIRELNLVSTVLDTIVEQSTLISGNRENIFLVTEKYKVYLDTVDRTMLLKVRTNEISGTPEA